MPPCEVLVYVRSEKVIAEVRPIAVPVWIGLTPSSAWPTVRTGLVRKVERRLEEGQRRAIAEAHRLAKTSGNELHVVDLGRANPISRFLRMRLLRTRALPVVVVKGPCPWVPGLPAGGEGSGRERAIIRTVGARTA